MNVLWGISVGLTLGLAVGCRPGGASTAPGECVAPSDSDACNFIHAGCCYESSKSACAAAGCPDDCVIAESFPAQPVCD